MAPVRLFTHHPSLKLLRFRGSTSTIYRQISSLKPSLPSSSGTPSRSFDSFDLFDKSNQRLSYINSKNLSKHCKSSSSHSTSIPISETTGSSGQSAAIESHPSTSVEDLHALPPPRRNLDEDDGSSELSVNNKQDLRSIETDLGDGTVNWSRSFSGLSKQPFEKMASDILMAPLNPEDVEIKPDGVIYLPEIKYRRILNKAFGPGGWGLAPRGSSHVTSKNVSREYALICLGRLVSLARGEQDYYNGVDNIPTATEGCKSNALMRCCKDLGIASELWDPNYIQWWKKKYATVEWVSGISGSKKKGVWRKKQLDDWSPKLPNT
ncbi:mitochondrial genome maintenance MGM101-domain-containing protein [Phakopsora pachyrhizi]|uniref:Mitochondrial genome maintenance protein MGM101 n=1 Tax=Phakopsora pachyrhizi TaxID=170000 RepID=A0AAV0AKH0_PHAPC|nr:mitochondrial genome maintenance MGM101-domain-containing protein [Phakopsora pachyrhizi]CAH7669027.1 mitochondrial genome maintenance MGM101-domain-containing protein [Phakopsora pachyrhizi]